MYNGIIRTIKVTFILGVKIPTSHQSRGDSNIVGIKASRREFFIFSMYMMRRHWEGGNMCMKVAAQGRLKNMMRMKKETKPVKSSAHPLNLS